jgi:hypothetical protein
MSDDLEKRLEEAAKRIAKIGDEIKQQVEEALEKKEKNIDVTPAAPKIDMPDANRVKEDGLQRIRETVDSVSQQFRATAEDVSKGLEGPTKEALASVQDAFAKVQERIESVRAEGKFDEFAAHQKRALEEAVKALEELIPEGLRTHGKNALGEAYEGFSKLFAGLFPQAAAESEAQRVMIETELDAPAKPSEPSTPVGNTPDEEGEGA